jgi:gluconokinase
MSSLEGMRHEETALPSPLSLPGARVVVMGVAGSGKSSLAAALARWAGLPLIEGDDHHCERSRLKMRAGIPLDDDDRHLWLQRLERALAAAPGGAVLTCSALKRRYRERLRAASPGVRFVFLAIDPGDALERVSRRPGHFFAPTLMDSQFAALEPPAGEAGVLCLDATRPMPQLLADAVAWLRAPHDRETKDNGETER